TYIQILSKMRYPFLISWLLRIPGIYHIAKTIYRNIADNRQRIPCDQACMTPVHVELPSFYASLFEHTHTNSSKNLKILSKIVFILFLLQLNSTIHYGLLYRFQVDSRNSALSL